MKWVVPVVAAALLLTGCSDSAPATESTAQAAPTEAAPQVEYSSPEQLASVISEYEGGWREVADQQTECRLIWAIDSQEDPIAAMNGYSCFLTEQTASINASLASEKLEALTPSPEMEELVNNTVAVLQPISAVNWAESCGTDSWPADTAACDDVLGSNTMYFTMLTSRLDAWGPYL